MTVPHTALPGSSKKRPIDLVMDGQHGSLVTPQRKRSSQVMPPPPRPCIRTSEYRNIREGTGPSHYCGEDQSSRGQQHVDTFPMEWASGA